MSVFSSIAAESGPRAARAATRSPAERWRFSASTHWTSEGSSRTAGPKYESASNAAGRCIPGIFTKPPSGIAPMPYSIPFRVVLTIAGGKPT